MRAYLYVGVGLSKLRPTGLLVRYNRCHNKYPRLVQGGNLPRDLTRRDLFHLFGSEIFKVTCGQDSEMDVYPTSRHVSDRD